MRQFSRNSEQDDGDDDERPRASTSQHVVDRDLDEVACRNRSRSALTPFGRTRLRSLRRGLDLPGQLDRVGVGLFLNARR